MVSSAETARYILRRLEEGWLKSEKGFSVTWDSFRSTAPREVRFDGVLPDRQTISTLAERVADLLTLFPNLAAKQAARLVANDTHYLPMRLSPLEGISCGVDVGDGDMRVIAQLPKGVRWLQPLDNKALRRVGRTLRVCLGQYYLIAPNGADKTPEKYAVRVTGSGEMDLCIRSDDRGWVREIRRLGNDLPTQVDVEQVEQVVVPALALTGVSLDHGVDDAPAETTSPWWATIQSWNGPLEALADWLEDQPVTQDWVYDVLEDIIAAHGIDAVEFFGDWATSILGPNPTNLNFISTWGGYDQHQADRTTVRYAEKCVANGGGTAGSHQVALARWGQAPISVDREVPATCWMLDAPKYSPKFHLWGVVRQADMVKACRAYKSRVSLQTAWDGLRDNAPAPRQDVMNFLVDVYGRSAVHKHTAKVLGGLR